MLGATKWTSAALVLAFLSGCVSGGVEQVDPATMYKQRPPKPFDQRRKIAIADFVDKSEYGKERVGAASADILATVLIDCEQFAVYDRQQLSKIMDEQKLGQSGAVDMSTAVQVGKLVGVDFIMYGTVSNVGFAVESTNVIFHQKKRQKATVTVDARMINCQTGLAVFGKQGDGVAYKDATGALGLGGRMSYDSSLLGQALRAAIYKMMDEIIDKAERTGQ